MNLEKLNGWQRIGVIASIVWLIISSALYFSVIGEMVLYQYSNSWIIYWYTINPLSAFIPLFSNGEAPNYPEFDLVGYAFFVLFPIGVMWALGNGVAWIKKGSFNGKQ